MDLSLNFDTNWHTEFRSDSLNVILRVVNLAQPMFYWTSLTTRIRLNLVEIKGHLDKTWVADEPTM